MDIHGRSHNFLLIHPREVLLGLEVLWHQHMFTSFESGLVWGMGGTPVPCMTDAYTQGNANL